MYSWNLHCCDRTKMIFKLNCRTTFNEMVALHGLNVSFADCSSPDKPKHGYFIDSKLTYEDVLRHLKLDSTEGLLSSLYGYYMKRFSKEKKWLSLSSLYGHHMKLDITAENSVKKLLDHLHPISTGQMKASVASGAELENQL